MWTYERKLQYPVNIKTTNADMALAIMSQYGGLYCNCTLFFKTKLFCTDCIPTSSCTGAILLLFLKYL